MIVLLLSLLANAPYIAADESPYPSDLSALTKGAAIGDS